MKNTQNQMSRKEVISFLRDMKPSYDLAIFVPHCLRSDYCGAETKQGVIECVGCGRDRRDGEPCNVGRMKEIAESRNNGDINTRFYILNGGSVLPKVMIRDGKPKRALGIACVIELGDARELMAKIGVKTGSLKLLRDGCSETVVDFLEYKYKVESY